MRTDNNVFYAPPGTGISYTGRGGYKYERESAAAALNIGQVYTLEHVEIKSSSSYLTLKEFPGKKFNTVMFSCGWFDQPYHEWNNTFNMQYF